MLHALKISLRPASLIIRAGIIGVYALCSFTYSAAQNIDSLKTLQHEYKRKARQSELQADLYQAIYFYEQYFNAGGYDQKLAYRLANLYYDTRDYTNAYFFYDSVLTEPKRKYVLSYYRKGVVSMNLGRYDEAIENLDIYRKKTRGKKDPDQLRRQARDLATSAAWALERTDSIADIDVFNIGTSVNKPHIEFSPHPVSSVEFIYGSLIADSLSPEQNMRQLYRAGLRDGEWITLGELQGPFNDRQLHTGNAAISPDGERIYFTRCRRNWRDKRICEIFVSNLEDGEWQEAVKLPYPVNDDNYTTTQPAVGINLRTGTDILYFVSDRAGTRGGLDIWYTVYDSRSGSFKEPKNVGSKINTRGNECCPFYDNDTRTLYFSSTNWPGFGGYDIHRNSGSARKWADRSSLPQPVNSSYDDMYFSLLPGVEEGFFTSNRPGSYAMDNGSCCDDIFYFRFNECTRVPLRGKVLNITNYDIYDELNERYQLGLEYPRDSLPAEGTPVQLFILGQEEEDEILVSQTLTDANGEYGFSLEIDQDYKLVVKNFGFFDKVSKVSARSKKCSETVDAGITKISALPEITVRFNVYYEHDKARLSREARTKIDTLLLPVFDLFPNAVIEIGSHTDNTGSDDYNITLSQRRSESVVNYLIQKGISSDRLVAQGYGESAPIAPNQNPDGTDNPEGRQLNRRTEMRIVGEINTFYLDE